MFILKNIISAVFFSSIVSGCGSCSRKRRDSDTSVNERGSSSSGNSADSSISTDGFAVNDPAFDNLPITPAVRKKMPREFKFAGLHDKQNLFSLYIPDTTYQNRRIPIYVTSDAKSEGKETVLIAKTSENGICQRTEGFFMFGGAKSSIDFKIYVTIITSNLDNDAVDCGVWEKGSRDLTVNEEDNELLRYQDDLDSIPGVINGLIMNIFESPQLLTSVRDRTQVRIRAILVSKNSLN